MLIYLRKDGQSKEREWHIKAIQRESFVCSSCCLSETWNVSLLMAHGTSFGTAVFVACVLTGNITVKTQDHSGLELFGLFC
jgi:hypothetical protein